MTNLAMICPACQGTVEEAADTCPRCGKSLFTLTKGAVLGDRYEIVKPLGRGGMGAVYQARDRTLDEIVALKVLGRETASSEQAARRFISEVKLARQVRHKNVCAIHEYGEHGHLRFIAMEFVDGVDLKDILRVPGRLPLSEAFEISSQILSGLAAIHEAGIVHRDLKTSNIMLDRKGLVRLMDFGIAKRQEPGAATPLTATGLVVGTPEYLSPEQAQGEPVDVRSDLYSLGIVIFEIFTGEVPFKADTPFAVILKQVEAPPPLVGGAAELLPGSLVPVLRRALAKRREDRYPSAQEMHAGLQEALAGALREDRSSRTQPPAPGPPAAAGTGFAGGDSTLTMTAGLEAHPAVTEEFEDAQDGAWIEEAAATVAPARTPTQQADTQISQVGSAGAGPTRQADASSPAGRIQALRSPPAPSGGQETARVAPPRARTEDRAASAATRTSPDLARRRLPPKPARPGSRRIHAAAAIALGLAAVAWAVWRSSQALVPAPSTTAVASLRNEAAARVPPSTQLGPGEADLGTPLEPGGREEEAKELAAGPLALEGSAQAPAGPPPPAIPAPPPASRQGWLKVAVSPWADVVIDGTAIGTTPFEPVALESGSHTVRLVHPSYGSAMRTVTVLAGGTTELRVDMTALARPASTSPLGPAPQPPGSEAPAGPVPTAPTGPPSQAGAPARPSLPPPAQAPGRTFATSHTSVQGASVRKTEMRGFDTSGVRKPPDFQGAIAFDVSPPEVKPGDSYTVGIFLTNQGEKSVKLQQVTALTIVNGTRLEVPVELKSRLARAGSKVLVGELVGIWGEGVASWVLDVTVVSDKGETYRSRLSAH